MNDTTPEPASRQLPAASPSRVRADSGGTKDGLGAGDHDSAFSGFRPYHFSTRQMTRLLLLRGEILDAALGVGRFTDDVVQR